MAALSPFAATIHKQKYSLNGEEDWEQTCERVVTSVMGDIFPELVDKTTQAMIDLKFIGAGRYLRNAGRPFAQLNNCYLVEVEDSKEGWGYLAQRVAVGTMNSAGIGVVYSKLRSKGSPVGGMGGTSTGPVALMNMVNEIGRNVMGGGSRRAALWAGLHWHHPDVFDFIAMKDWPDYLREQKEKDFNTPAPMDMTNISVILDDDFFDAMEDEDWVGIYDDGESGHLYEVNHAWAQKVYWSVIEKMLTTGEPGFSVDTGVNAGEHLRNPCTEITSRDDNDVCNLGSINMARVESKEEFAELVELGTAFLLCGTIVSEVPFPETVKVREKNRRIGLGLMGIADWLVQRGKPYGPDEELGEWLEIYANNLEITWKYADRAGVSRPVKGRAIAPNGTLAILAGCQSSGEPFFAPATKRRYLKNEHGTWVYQYTVDASTQRAVDMGIDPSTIDYAYNLDPRRRVEFQAWLQQYVDHGISSTVNLPSPDQQTFSHEEFGNMLLEFLPGLRGITTYPDGARGGQPLTVVPYEEAYGWEGVEFEETGNEVGCISGVCGI